MDWLYVRIRGALVMSMCIYGHQQRFWGFSVVALELRPCGNHVGVNAIPETKEVRLICKGWSTKGYAVETVEKCPRVQLGHVVSYLPCPCWLWLLQKCSLVRNRQVPVMLGSLGKKHGAEVPGSCTAATSKIPGRFKGHCDSQAVVSACVLTQ